MLQSDPKANLDDVLRTIGDQEYQVNYTDDATFPQPELHPTIAEYGERTDKNSSGTKKATLIANENYPNAVLQGVTGQATSLEGQLSSRGYVSSGVVTDKNAADMGAAWNGMVNGAQPGDELVAYFIGHRAPTASAASTGATSPTRRWRVWSAPPPPKAPTFVSSSTPATPAARPRPCVRSA